MKIKKIFCFVAVISIICILFGCGFDKSHFIITDCKTNEVVVKFSSKEYVDETIVLTNALNNRETFSGEINPSKKYSIHYVDPKNSYYDVWYYVYIENDNLYIQMDTDRMKGIEDNTVKKCTSMTVDEFISILKTGDDSMS